MTTLPGYDSWLEEPYQEMDCYEPLSSGEAVSASHGIFNWMVFALNNERRNVPETTWSTLIEGPFPSPWLKIRFALCYLRCFFDWLLGAETPPSLAKGVAFMVSERSAYFADMEYYSAAFEAEQVWEGRDHGRLVFAKEDEHSFSINFYPILEDFSDEQSD